MACDSRCRSAIRRWSGDGASTDHGQVRSVATTTMTAAAPPISPRASRPPRRAPFTGDTVSEPHFTRAWSSPLLNLASRNGAVERLDIATAYIGRTKQEVLLGPRIWDYTRDKDMLDFGCGPGNDAVEIAEPGASHVIGMDLRQRWLDFPRTPPRAASPIAARSRASGALPSI